MSRLPATEVKDAARLAAASFTSVHGRPPQGVWSAPGRVNLVGEHTDYNGGCVLPFALPHRTAVAVAPRGDRLLTIATLGSDGRVQRAEPVELRHLRPGRPSGWAAYVAGVVWVLRDHGIELGADLVVATDVPAGAGLASSAALECATALALLGVAERPSPDDAQRATIARWAQRAENDFVGVPTGVLDQMASLCCIADHVLFFDVSTDHREQVPFAAEAANLAVLVIDTRVRHRNSDSGYADRRRATDNAARLLGLGSLGELTPTDLADALIAVPRQLRPLVHHVVTENARVLDVVRLLRQHRYADIGPLLDASHDSLRDDYRVSSPELDLAVHLARSAGALGARMTGAGFGGSAIALVHTEALPRVASAIRRGFRSARLRTPRLFTAVPSQGAGRG
ncbi:galactokinase [Saccharomonospora xinjiangensis]|uniref:Galactokinase n=1 Tax=Saccharomonospora xinjiangensis XJ-54 TaxID=882086 RepID=I0V6A4_9PSEU|nr:galactokinase [Saccharomonospora xinjiangensis]EID55657.1 galactokinase [Saccharomonospora xinjiangensis XJ-54]